MKAGHILAILVLTLTICSAQISRAVPMGTAFTYEGRLIDANSPADGKYDFEFKLYDGPSGAKSLYSYIKSNTGSALHDSSVLQTILTESSSSTTCDYVTLWISGDGYTTTSRYAWHITLILTDGTNTHSERLRCDCWGLNEGCTPNHFDNYDATATGSDGRTWKRYTREIPWEIDKSKLTIKLQHRQASWDYTSASSWFRLDNIYFSDSQGNICEPLGNGDFEQDPTGTSFNDISSWNYSSEDAYGADYVEQLEIVDDYYCDISIQQGSTIDVNELDVVDGHFMVGLDFGSDVFTGDARWLEIGVRPGEFGDPSAYTVLRPRQEITPVPYALQTRGMFVDTAGNVGIGTTSPGAQLHVRADGRTDDGIRVTNVGTQVPAVGFFSKNDSRWGICSSTAWGDFNITQFDSGWNRSPTTPRFIIRENGNVGIGTIHPAYKLDVEGDVQAHAYHTGDIFFQKDGHELWRMFEDEQGLYLESLKTGEIYSFVLREIENTAQGSSAGGLDDVIEGLQEDNEALRKRLELLEKTVHQHHFAITKEVRK